LSESPETLRAGQKVEPLKTLSNVPPGIRATAFDTQMKTAETRLKEGKFMDAVDEYQHALAMQPGNALALVGRAHAELGAGMYQSAAMDLKAVFLQKPEMMSVRYTLNEFIPQKRIEALMNDLLGLTTRDRTSNMASFLYCYLAYNTDHPNELQQELDRWGIRPAHDEWQAIALKAWGKQQ
jgi:predicted Zn-dependent protease